MRKLVDVSNIYKLVEVNGSRLTSVWKSVEVSGSRCKSVWILVEVGGNTWKLVEVDGSTDGSTQEYMEIRGSFHPTWWWKLQCMEVLEYSTSTDMYFHGNFHLLPWK